MHALRNWKSCGLSRKWTGRVWLNPPYSNVHEWLAKMVRHGRGTLLVNARPETKWFQDAVRQADAVLWLRGRVNFERPDGGPTHNAVGSVLVAFGTADAAALMRCNLPGLRMVISAFEGVPS